jgi:hypothetical protein
VTPATILPGEKDALTAVKNPCIPEPEILYQEFLKKRSHEEFRVFKKNRWITVKSGRKNGLIYMP